MKTGHWLPILINGVLCVCAVVVTALVIREEFFPPPAPQAVARQAVQVSNWRKYAAGGHRSGPSGSPVSIVVFSDFQCPACRTLASHLKVIRAEFPEDVSIVYRHAPLRSHPHAVTAARASECAGRQGRFEAFHDALFGNQPSIGLVPWARFAEDAGVPDVPDFERCLASGDPAGTLESDTLDARSLKVSSTPTFMVNGVQYLGAPPLETLRTYVQRAVDSAVESRRSGEAAAASSSR